MCARYSLAAPPNQLEKLLDVPMPEGIQPRYNIAPTQSVVAVRAESGEAEATFLRWGLVPSWAEDLSIGQRLINARAETAAERPSFRSAFRKRRCLIPASSFFEWMHVQEVDERLDEALRDVEDAPTQLALFGTPKEKVKAAVRKQPYLIGLANGEPFAFAGLWERWHGPDDRPVDTCTVLTTEPNALVARLHNRMPCLLERDQFHDWLDPELSDVAHLSRMLVPYDDDRMRSHPVNSRVSNVRNEGPDLIQPLELAS